jgi:hypothetical protein
MLDRRLDALEAGLHLDENPSLVEALHAALAEARRRRQQGLHVLELIDDDHPYAERLRRPWHAPIGSAPGMWEVPGKSPRRPPLA